MTFCKNTQTKTQNLQKNNVFNTKTLFIVIIVSKHTKKPNDSN